MRFCVHTVQQNATVGTGGTYSAPPDSIAGFKGAASRQGKEGRRREGKGKGGEGKGRGGKVDSDAQLGQGRRLAKTGPVGVIVDGIIINKKRCQRRVAT